MTKPSPHNYLTVNGTGPPLASTTLVEYPIEQIWWRPSRLVSRSEAQGRVRSAADRRPFCALGIRGGSSPCGAEQRGGVSHREPLPDRRHSGSCRPLWRTRHRWELPADLPVRRAMRHTGVGDFDRDQHDCHAGDDARESAGLCARGLDAAELRDQLWTKSDARRLRHLRVGTERRSRPSL